MTSAVTNRSHNAKAVLTTGPQDTRHDLDVP